MRAGWIISFALIYVFLLFIIAYLTERQADKGRSITHNPYVYALSLAVYCTAWTYYGSVGRAAYTGLGFLPIYLGPTILAPLFFIVLRKIILISKYQRITSIADFVSSRYGKSTVLGMIVTLALIIGIVPYISLQLKAIAFSIRILTLSEDTFREPIQFVPFYKDSALYIATALTFFTILFGVRKLDANERHEGLVAAIAFESLIKLVAFLSVGIFVTYGLFDGFGDLFSRVSQNPSLSQLFTMKGAGLDGWSWLWLTIISMSAVLLLPRQFHMAVVENPHPSFTRKAAWLFPLYLFLINIFVLPIAFGGEMIFTPEQQIEADTYVLNIPLQFGKEGLAVFACLGGLSAATSMVIVSVIALSIMVSNNLVLPAILKTSAIQERQYMDFDQRFLGIRRVSVVVILFLAYGFYKLIGVDYPLVSIGLISFTAVAQLLPAIIGGLYWKRMTKKGVTAGIIAGFFVWAYTLPLPTLIESGLISDQVLSEGPWGIGLLRPNALLGSEGMSLVAHSAFWSLLINFSLTIGISLFSRQSVSEISQANIFVDIEKYRDKGSEIQPLPRSARTTDILLLLNRFLGNQRAQRLIRFFEKKNKKDVRATEEADPEFIHFAETHLAGSIGAASARIIIGSTTREEKVSLEEMLHLIEQTREIMDYSKELEQKSIALEDSARQLRSANERLKELDKLKAEFINTITHELRTPITSIKAFSRILLDHPELEEEKRASYLEIVVSECERVSRLVNQVLDIRKLENEAIQLNLKDLDICEVVTHSFKGVQQLFEERSIDYSCELPSYPLFIEGDRDRLIQVFINLLSNAIKFCAHPQGEVSLRIREEAQHVRVEVWDNGAGIPDKDKKIIFEQFTQVSDKARGKPQGTGLGLYISKILIDQHKGHISVASSREKGTTFCVRLPLIKNDD
jgi:Na+/proline symporter/nitrogen-specific signal transduction histidine kinase